jgi:hypothetical protein
MKPVHQVLILSDSCETFLPQLERYLEESKSTKLKFIHPKKVYRTDFKESDFILIDYEFYKANKEVSELAFEFLDKLSMFATLTDHEQLNEILKETKVSHLFGMSGTHTLNDIGNFLTYAVEKKFWNAETFITPPITHQSHTKFDNSENIEGQIQSAISHHDLTNTFEGFRPILEQILNESITNALYNAPVDSEGKFLHRHVNRREVIHSAQNMAPTLDIIEDADKIVLNIKDFYGTLTKDIIDHYLTHGKVAEKEGGAGVGLYLILKHAHKLVINIDHGNSTEFIIVIHKFKRFFHYQVLEKSFHLFERKQS